MIGDSSVVNAGLLNLPEIERRMTEHRQGKRDWGFALWKIMQLALWYRQWFSGQVPS